jgi:hypothetical protein
MNRISRDRLDASFQKVVGGSPSGGATAQCNDGTLSYSQHAEGTCSWHGGVDHWINYPG